MRDHHSIDTAPAADEARAAAEPPHVWSSDADVINSALMRYLAARRYRQVVEEVRESDDHTPAAS